MTTIESRLAPFVIGVDSALSRTGVAIIERLGDGCRARTFVIATNTPIDVSLTERHKRIDLVRRSAADIIRQRAELALIEAPALAAEFGNSHDRSAVWWWVVDIILGLKTPVAEVAPTTLKKWCTGHGGSAKKPVEKRHIVAAMHEMWPNIGCTVSELRHHECEALAMAHMCAQRLGWPVPTRKHHGLPMAVVKWPALAGVLRP
jgi:Holliday junction resolvasome RuvABC endonuclease subunit